MRGRILWWLNVWDHCWVAWIWIPFLSHKFLVISNASVDYSVQMVKILRMLPGTKLSIIEILVLIFINKTNVNAHDRWEFRGFSGSCAINGGEIQQFSLELPVPSKPPWVLYPYGLPPSRGGGKPAMLVSLAASIMPCGTHYTPALLFTRLPPKSLSWIGWNSHKWSLEGNF